MSENTEQRPFGFWTATAMVIGGVIGAGIFVLPSQLAAFGWTGVAAWGIGGIGALLIARVLSSVAEARPDEPGLIEVIGEVLGPLFGLVNGWGAWVSYWCANAYLALTAVRYGAEFMPQIAATPLSQALSAVAVLAAITLLNLAGLRASGRFQVVTTILKLLPLLAVLVILGGLGLDGGDAFSREVHPPLVIGDLFSAVSLVFVAIIGFESASIAAERVRNPQRNVPLGTMVGVAMTSLIYLAVCSGIVFAMPQAELAASSAPIAQFIATFWSREAGLAVAAFAVISVVGCLNVWVMMQGEVPLGLARAGLLPAWLARTNSRDIAVVPLVLASSLAGALLLLASWRSGAALMDFMLRLTAVSGLWIYVFACITALKLRIRTVSATLGLLFATGILYGAGLETVGLSVALLVAALPLYWLAQRATINSAAASG